MSNTDVQDPDFNPYDSDNFVSTSPMNGRKGVVTDAEVVKWNYGGTRTDLTTALKVSVFVAEFDKPHKDLYFTAGGLEPSTDGKEKAIAGPYLLGAINKQSNVSDFLSNLKASGFPIAELAPSKGKGFGALKGAEITFKTIDKKIGKGATKPYDVPGEFHGFVSLDNIPAKPANTDATEGQTAPTLAPATAAPADDTLKAQVSEAIVAALRESPNGEIQRSQLSLKVGPKLSDPKTRSAALALLINVNFLSTVPGTTFDKTTIKLS